MTGLGAQNISSKNHLLTLEFPPHDLSSEVFWKDELQPAHENRRRLI
jgi:hypothetical protein